MQIKILLLSLIFGLFLVVAMMGCSHDHDSAGNHGHSHPTESVNHNAEKADKAKSKSHKSIN